MQWMRMDMKKAETASRTGATTSGRPAAARGAREAPAAAAPAAPAAPASPAEPDVAAAFELLLAEELGEVPAGQFHPHTIQLTDDLIDRISIRVVERLTKGPLSETMTRIVTEVSERLVREEITRIRASADVKNR
jgi:hypothetical protein